MIPNEMHTPLLEAKGLSVDFVKQGRPISILKQVNFALYPQKTLGIVGESGSGKTVTALTILNLIPSPPLLGISGEILFNGVNLLQCSKKKLRTIRGRQIAYIFQEPMTALNPVLTIGEQIVEMIRAHQAIERKAAWHKAVRLLSEVGLSSPDQRMKNYPHELSGGMRQRAMIAMALSCDPEILIADEPTTALDVTIQAQVLDLFKALIASRGMSILFVTHDLSVMAEIADDLLVMKDGAVVESGAIETVFDHPRHPYTQELLSLI